MTGPALHPEATDDPNLVRWRTNTARLPEEIPELTQLIDQGILMRVEVDFDEVRTWLGSGRSWAADGPRVRSALLEALSSPPPNVALSEEQLRRRIEDVLARDIAPIADSHGGGVRVVSVCDGVLIVELTGACRGCSASEHTVGQLVTRAVRDRHPEIREVRAVKSARPVWLSLTRRSRRATP